jgi:hypothetical protein
MSDINPKGLEELGNKLVAAAAAIYALDDQKRILAGVAKDIAAKRNELAAATQHLEDAKAKALDVVKQAHTDAAGIRAKAADALATANKSIEAAKDEVKAAKAAADKHLAGESAKASRIAADIAALEKRLTALVAMEQDILARIAKAKEAAKIAFGE